MLDTDGLTQGASTDGVEDGGPADVVDIADVTAEHAGPIKPEPDSGDVGPNPDADASSSWCAAIEGGFCEDFDSAEAIRQPPWNIKIQPQGVGSVTIDSALTSSAPRSALLKVNAPAASCSYAELVKTEPAESGGVRLGFDVYVADGLQERDMGIAYVGQQGGCAVVLFPGDGARVFVQTTTSGEVGTSYSLAGELSAATWSRVLIDVSFADKKAKVDFDGWPVVEAPLAASCATSAKAVVYIGPHCTPSPASVRVDNVVIETY